MKTCRFILLFIGTVLFSTKALSQDFSFSILPLSINPAFTGMFEGKLRANGLYKNQRTTTPVNFIAYGGSVDGRILIKQGGYFAVGLGALDGKMSNGSFDNSSGIVSVAYHKILRHNKKLIGEIAAGVQAGYIDRSLTLSTGKKFLPLVYHTGLGATYFIMNAGISFSQYVGKKFNYTIGLSGNNLNLLNDGTVNAEHPLLKVTPSGTVLAIANWKTSERLTMRPAVLHIISKDFYIAGNEFRYTVSGKTPTSIAFLDLWYRSLNIISVTPGIEFWRLRVAAGVDYRLQPGNSSSYGGFQLAARYIQPLPKKGKQ